MTEKERSVPAARLETFEELAKRYEGLDPEVMHAYVTMRRAQGRIELALETHLATHGLSLGRFLVMAHLMRAEGHSLAPAQLAGLCGITRASITGLIDTLEKAGLVAREEDPDDRRSVQVRLTLTGRRLMLAILPDHFRRLMKMMSALTLDELKVVQTLSQKLAASASALEEP